MSAAPGPQRNSLALRILADRFGILPEYIDQSGKERRVTSDETRVALLAAMEIEAADDTAARCALEQLEHEERERLLSPVRVVRGDTPPVESVRVLVPGGRPATADWSISLMVDRRAAQGADGRADSEAVSTLEGSGQPDGCGSITIPLPATPGFGYHTLRLRLDTGTTLREAEQSLIVVPRTCPTFREWSSGRKLFAIVTNLYSVRSGRNWGVGDLTDLAELLRWGEELGAALVGVNPLHALRNRGGDISPYSPVSRLFRNPWYLDVEAVPELVESVEARELLASTPFRRELERLRATDHVEYEAVMALKRSALLAMYRTFRAKHLSADTPRGRAFREYVHTGGEALASFATFCALEEYLSGIGIWDAGFGGGGAERRAPSAERRLHWPPEYRDPGTPAVAAFRETHAEAVDFHRYLQFEFACQLERLGGGMELERRAHTGLYEDLAIGTSPNGSDVWAFPHLFVKGASVGAPPDDYSRTGQDWGLPPLNPHRLANDCYRYWILLLRKALSHSRALRIDHVLGLFRQFWIPTGKDGKDGAYVRFPSDDMLGILALEATRAGALVVGEDLGTVPPEVPPTLKNWGILGSKVLYFERDKSGGFLPAACYEEESLTTANTHDMPTLAGFWSGRDIAVKEAAGLLDTGEAHSARARRDTERTALLKRLAADGVLPEPKAPDDPAELRGAIHDFLCRTPAALVGLSLDDIVGETESVNLPGVGLDRYPSWTRRLALPVEALRTDAGVARALGECPRRRGR